MGDTDRQPRCARRLATAVCLVLLALCTAAGAVDMMKPSELRRGMKGKGRTVFHGTTIEQFDVEIVGVMTGTSPGRDMILAKVDAPVLRDGPVAAGMSGSPVYIKGKLIGAVAFTWGFSRDGLCGITPIHEMLADAAKPTVQPTAPVARRPVPPGLMAAMTGGRAPAVPGSGSATLKPIATPVMVAGCSPKLIEQLAPVMKRLGMVLVQSGGGGGGGAAREADKPKRDTRLRPGSAVGVRMIEGDIDYTAIGTVTHVDGNRVMAFGHPFMDEGDFSAPMTAAWVHGVVPSFEYPFKLAEGAQTVGAIDRDRSTVLAGSLGNTSDMLPVRVNIHLKDRDVKRVFNYRVLRHRDYSPFLAGVAAYVSYDRLAPMAGEKMVDLAMTIRMRGRAPLTLDDRFFDDGALVWYLLGMAYELNALDRNRFEKVVVEGVDFNVTVEEGQRTAFIHSMAIDGRRFKPGETVKAVVRLKPHRGAELIEKRFAVKIPEDIPVGTELTILACDGSRAEEIKREAAPGVYAPETLDQLFALVRQLERSDRLILHVALPRQGVSYRGRAMPDLPQSLVRVMGAGNQTGIAPVQDALIKRLRTDYVISGAASIGILVVEEK